MSVLFLIFMEMLSDFHREVVYGFAYGLYYAEVWSLYA
jgi:hypothetical protein